jgi:hypothetical protein
MLAVQKDVHVTSFNIQREPIGQFRENRLDAPESIIPVCDLASQVADMAKDSYADLLIMSARAFHRLLLRLRARTIAVVLSGASCRATVLRLQASPVLHRHSLLSVGTE